MGGCRVPTNAAIAGVAELPPTRDPGDATAMDFILRVARDAMADAALTPKDVDGLLLAPTFNGAPVTVSSMVADYLTVRPAYCDVVHLGGATAAGMVWRAAAAIDAGECSAVLCVLAEAPDHRPAVRPRKARTTVLRPCSRPARDRLLTSRSGGSRTSDFRRPSWMTPVRAPRAGCPAPCSRAPAPGWPPAARPGTFFPRT